MLDKLVKQTIHISLFVQVITTVLSLDGFTLKLSENDQILKEILGIETIVQLVEGVFYVWIISSLNDLNKMTPRRYIDWFITTPTMLFSTIIFFKYNELKEKGISKPMTALGFYNENKENVQKIVIYNALMLLFGYLGETGVIDKKIGVPVGFIFFYLSFELIYKEYAVKSKQGVELFKLLTVLWSLYGVAAILPVKQKNICYNFLDIFSKNFYGLYIYYKIRQFRIKE